MRTLIFACILVFLGGCSSTVEPTEKPASNVRQALEYDQPAIERKGSLFKSNQMLTLFADRRAYRVGDILTVVLNERTQSSKRAATALEKDTEIGLAVPNAGNLNTNDLNLGINSSSAFDGSSQANQENFLSGAISVRVTRILPNGAMLISGEKHLTLNRGDEYIRLEGVVRPEDIDVSNRVSSQRIADASISYSGEGDHNNVNRPGWFTRLFNYFLNPF